MWDQKETKIIKNHGLVGWQLGNAGGVLFEPGTSGEWNIVERFGMCFFPAGNGKHRETMCAYMIIYGSS